MKKFLTELAQRPTECLTKVIEQKKLSYAFCGYALGVISLYFAIKLTTQNEAFLSGFFFTFLFWFFLNVIFNFILAAISHLLLEFSGEKSKALGMFILLGISQLFLTLMVPWCLIARAANQIAFLTPLIVLAVLCMQIYFVLTAMQKVYGLSKASALLAFIGSVILPVVCGFCLMVFLIGMIITLIA